MKMKKVLSVVLASTFVCGSIGFAHPEGDVSTTETLEKTQFLRAYLKGYEDETVRPDGNITRAEAVTIYSRLKEQSSKVEASDVSKFSDVDAEGWYKSYIDYAVENGVIDGYEDGSFKPDAAITRAEFSKILAKTFEEAEGESSFSDVPEGHWAKGAIDVLFTNKKIDGYEDGTFAPDKAITRAEAVKILNRIYERSTDKDSFAHIDAEAVKSFGDLPEEHWAYYEILDAANNHVIDSDDGDWIDTATDEEVKAAEKYLVSESEALKALGLDAPFSTVAVPGWQDAYTVVSSGADVVGVPDDHHLDGKIINSYPNIIDHDGAWDLDVLKEQKPSLIYMDKEALDDEENAEVKKVLEDLGTRQAHLKLNRVDDMMKNMGILASASNSRDAHVNSMLKINERIEAVKAKSEANNNPSVALVILTDDKEGNKEYYIAAEDTFGADLVRLGGMKNLGDSFKGEDKDRFGFVKTSLEDIMKEDPDAFVVMVRTSDKKTRGEEEKKFYELLKKDYADKKAVKSGRYGRIDHHGVLPKSTLGFAGMEAISGVANKVDVELPDEFKDGVYEGEGTGYAAGLKTKVTVKDGKIAKVEVLSHGETGGISDPAIKEMPERIVKEGKPDVDTVSGATMTSKGIIQSVKDALSKML